VVRASNLDVVLGLILCVPGISCPMFDVVTFGQALDEHIIRGHFNFVLVLYIYLISKNVPVLRKSVTF